MRDIPVGNGSLLVSFDKKYQIRDVYFPHIGQENHAGGSISRFGIWVDGRFSWLSDDSWTRTLRYVHETLVTDVVIGNPEIGIEVTCNDTVASHENIFLRRITVKNLFGGKRSIRLFLHHDLLIYENPVGDTAYFDPATKSVIHYKKHRYFLFGTAPRFESFATGRKGFREHEGTWRDAEDGFLSGASKTEGSVDSTICVHAEIEARSEFEAFYWMAAATSYDEVAALNNHVLERGPEQYLEYTSNYWRVWVNKNDTDFGSLAAPIVDLYKRSLLIIRTQTDNDGAILAANDSDVTVRATDHYSYLWTRDGAFIANALDLAGYSHLTRKFFDLCSRIVHPDGYFQQKYNPDGTLASGWHAAWDPATESEMVPIQEDETALVLWALWEHYDKYRDIEFAHRLYTDLVVKCADFMVGFRHAELGLPAPSWNLWEDRRGIHTFTCSTVVAGLRAAAHFAELFAENERAAEYRKAADEFAEMMKKHLYSENLGRFIRSLQFDNGNIQPDTTIDASLFAVFYFAVFKADDPMVAGTMRSIEENLMTNGGVVRFHNDGYMRAVDSPVGNAWFICTLWLADYYVAAAKSVDDLKKAERILNWTVAKTLPSGVLAEQIDTASGEHISVSPLTWSHSTFVATVHSYMAAHKRLN